MDFSAKLGSTSPADVVKSCAGERRNRMENAILALAQAVYYVMKICNWPVLTEETDQDKKSKVTRIVIHVHEVSQPNRGTPNVV